MDDIKRGSAPVGDDFSGVGDNITLKDSIEYLWGFRGVPFPGDFSEIKEGHIGKRLKYYGDKLEELDDKGFKIFTEGLKGKKIESPITVLIDGLEYQLPLPTFKITGTKNIVSTPLAAGVGSVKELVSVNGFIIEVSGLIYSSAQEYPQKEIAEFKKIWKHNDVVTLQNVVMAEFLEEKDNVVVKEVEISDEKGILNGIPYKLKFESNNPIELIIN
ncbi:MAG: DUF6046 domain-containing protein [Bacteroidales bacterium]|jgi:hypothetical protein|nr:DUF6046 domain-containing protein [Bacteroidales bacterium]